MAAKGNSANYVKRDSLGTTCAFARLDSITNHALEGHKGNSAGRRGENAGSANISRHSHTAFHPLHSSTAEITRDHRRWRRDVDRFSRNERA